ncbi:MAG: starch-binding protein [Ruminococcus sp.]|nr:starch-binding protein [Ruminococcus sp.]
MKKSTSKKLNIFRTSPLISAVALLEVIVLLCVSTFAWFVFSENNKLESGVITVETDSGLDIDFSNASEEDFINIRNYINDFSFEPVTSLDGRNIFVPTTGTLNSTDTNKIVFREATVNDMNSKYINIDFELKNNQNEDTKVFLSSKSYFNVSDTSGKAMRLAFYQNDGSQGAISGDMDTTPGGDDSSDEGAGDDDEEEGWTKVYFDATSCGWTDPYCEFGGGTSGVESNGTPMTKLDGYENIYFVDIPNDSTFCKFSKGGESGYQTVQLEKGSGTFTFIYKATYSIVMNGDEPSRDPNSNQIYLTYEMIEYGQDSDTSGGSTGGSSGGGNTEDDSGDTVDATTVYFYNSEGWTKPHIFVSKSSDNSFLKNWPGYEMKKVSGNIYYFTFSSEYDILEFSDGNSVKNNSYITVQKDVQNGHIYSLIGLQHNSTKVYEVTSTNYEGTYGNGTYPVICPGVSTGFKEPYAPVVAINDANGDATSVVPAFASSIDEYSYSEDNSPLFTIRPNETISLSMIIWLEGTDDYCTNATYAGKNIDINIVFATSASDEELYTYRFIDQTKECWIVDDKKENGLTYKPVMQLYDADNNKGYRMKTTSSTRIVYNNEGKSVEKHDVWEVKAPADIINSQKIMFRRVNPNNENEVWNYWDAGEFISADNSLDEVQGVVTFTAFGDGAPTNVTGSGAPTLSCGGLWGAHNVELLTICDASKEEGNPNSNGYLEINNGALTINFEHEGRTIEYKASGPSSDFYYFMVPDFIMDKNDANRPKVQLKRYYNVDKEHALNSTEYQTRIKFDSDSFNNWGSKVDKCCGHYFSVNQTKGGTFNNYWGDDIIYVQASDALGSQMDQGLWQVRFYSDQNGNDTNSSKYAYLYRNFADTFNSFRTYPCVIPSDKKYYHYRVEQCDSGNPDTRWNRTELIKINHDTATDVQYYSNTVDDDKVICKMESLTHTIFFQMPSTYSSQNTYIPYIYPIPEKSDDPAFPGTSMSFYETVDNGDNKYMAKVNITDYNQVVFSTQNIIGLVPSDDWKSNSAWFAAYFYKSSDSNSYKWVTGVWKNNVVYAEAPVGYDMVIWCRMNPAFGDLAWDGDGKDRVWNQTGNLDADSNYTKQYKVDGWASGQWENNGSRLQSQDFTIGSASDRNGMILSASVSNAGITVNKVYKNENELWIEDGFDSTESIKYTPYPAQNWP